jgi:dynein heavy chain
MEHFNSRCKLYNDWQKEEPIVMWLSGLHIPGSYLTAIVQTSCRAKGWALDKSTLYTSVLKNRDPNEIKKRPDFGCMIRGLYLEGA